MTIKRIGRILVITILAATIPLWALPHILWMTAVEIFEDLKR